MNTLNFIAAKKIIYADKTTWPPICKKWEPGNECYYSLVHECSIMEEGNCVYVGNSHEERSQRAIS